MRTFVGDDELVQPKRNETALRSECRPTLKNALTQPRLVEMDEESASRQLDSAPDLAISLFRIASYSATWLAMARESHRRWLVQP